MKTQTNLQWEVVRGFGDFIDSPKDCFDVEVLKRRFATQAEAEAEAFAETHYERRIGKMMRQLPDWWQSFWVRSRPSKTNAEAVAAKFDAVLRSWLTADEYAEVLRRNRTNEYSGCCASHDYCDANMAMADAFESFNIDPDAASDLWNDAWEAWRSSTKQKDRFTTNPRTEKRDD